MSALVKDLTGNTDLVTICPQTVAITDAAVTMTPNRKYIGSIAAFTASRNYTVPAGSAGDTIEIQLTSGDDLYAIVIIGAAGVQINGGLSATEWSRLFITGEFIRLRCETTNYWWVEIDGRKPQYGVLTATVTAPVPITEWTQVLFNIQESNSSSASHANDRLLARRGGVYNFALHWNSLTVDTVTLLAITKNGPSATGPDNRIASTVLSGTTSGLGATSGGPFSASGVTAAAGDTFELLVYVLATATAVAGGPLAPRFAFTESL